MIDIYKDQQNILFVCPSEYWGTGERIAIRDMITAKEVGHNVFLYCLRDSSLHNKAKQLGIDCFFHTGKKNLKLRHWFQLSEVRKIIRNFDISIVHCYGLNFFWPISYFLRKKKKVSLILSLNSDIKKFYLDFYYRPLISRLDLVLLPLREMFESLHGHLDIPLMKMEFMGLGLQCSSQKMAPRRVDVWEFGTFVGGHVDDPEHVLPVLRTLSSLISHEETDRNFKLYLLSDKEWDKFVIYPELAKYIKEHAIEEFVSFEKVSDVESFQRKLHLWISLNNHEAIEDYTICALLNKVPVITPRNPFSMEILRQFGNVGRTYKASDSRELKNRCLEVTRDEDMMLQNLTHVSDQVERTFGVVSYKNQLLKLYERALNKRARLYGPRT